MSPKEEEKPKNDDNNNDQNEEPRKPEPPKEAEKPKPAEAAERRDEKLTGEGSGKTGKPGESGERPNQYGDFVAETGKFKPVEKGTGTEYAVDGPSRKRGGVGGGRGSDRASDKDFDDSNKYSQKANQLPGTRAEIEEITKAARASITAANIDGGDWTNGLAGLLDGVNLDGLDNVSPVSTEIQPSAPENGEIAAPKAAVIDGKPAITSESKPPISDSALAERAAERIAAAAQIDPQMVQKFLDTMRRILDSPNLGSIARVLQDIAQSRAANADAPAPGGTGTPGDTGTPKSPNGNGNGDGIAASKAAVAPGPGPLDLPTVSKKPLAPGADGDKPAASDKPAIAKPADLPPQPGDLAAPKGVEAPTKLPVATKNADGSTTYKFENHPQGLESVTLRTGPDGKVTVEAEPEDLEQDIKDKVLNGEIVLSSEKTNDGNTVRTLSDGSKVTKYDQPLPAGTKMPDGTTSTEGLAATRVYPPGHPSGLTKTEFFNQDMSGGLVRRDTKPDWKEGQPRGQGAPPHVHETWNPDHPKNTDKRVSRDTVRHPEKNEDIIVDRFTPDNPRGLDRVEHYKDGEIGATEFFNPNSPNNKEGCLYNQKMRPVGTNDGKAGPILTDRAEFDPNKNGGLQWREKYNSPNIATKETFVPEKAGGKRTHETYPPDHKSGLASQTEYDQTKSPGGIKLEQESRPDATGAKSTTRKFADGTETTTLTDASGKVLRTKNADGSTTYNMNGQPPGLESVTLKPGPDGKLEIKVQTAKDLDPKAADALREKVLKGEITLTKEKVNGDTVELLSDGSKLTKFGMPLNAGVKLPDGSTSTEGLASVRTFPPGHPSGLTKTELFNENMSGGLKRRDTKPDWKEGQPRGKDAPPHVHEEWNPNNPKNTDKRVSRDTVKHPDKNEDIIVDRFAPDNPRGLDRVEHYKDGEIGATEFFNPNSPNNKEGCLYNQKLRPVGTNDGKAGPILTDRAEFDPAKSGGMRWRETYDSPTIATKETFVPEKAGGLQVREKYKAGELAAKETYVPDQAGGKASREIYPSDRKDGLESKTEYAAGKGPNGLKQELEYKADENGEKRTVRQFADKQVTTWTDASGKPTREATKNPDGSTTYEIKDGQPPGVKSITLKPGPDGKVSIETDPKEIDPALRKKIENGEVVLGREKTKDGHTVETLSDGSTLTKFVPPLAAGAVLPDGTTATAGLKESRAYPPGHPSGLKKTETFDEKLSGGLLKRDTRPDWKEGQPRGQGAPPHVHEEWNPNNPDNKDKRVSRDTVRHPEKNEDMVVDRFAPGNPRGLDRVEYYKSGPLASTEFFDPKSPQNKEGRIYTQEWRAIPPNDGADPKKPSVSKREEFDPAKSGGLRTREQYRSPEITEKEFYDPEKSGGKKEVHKYGPNSNTGLTSQTEYEPTKNPQGLKFEREFRPDAKGEKLVDKEYADGNRSQTWTDASGKKVRELHSLVTKDAAKFGVPTGATVEVQKDGKVKVSINPPSVWPENSPYKGVTSIEYTPSAKPGEPGKVVYKAGDKDVTGDIVKVVPTAATQAPLIGVRGVMPDGKPAEAIYADGRVERRFGPNDPEKRLLVTEYPPAPAGVGGVPVSKTEYAPGRPDGKRSEEVSRRVENGRDVLASKTSTDTSSQTEVRDAQSKALLWTEKAGQDANGKFTERTLPDKPGVKQRLYENGRVETDLLIERKVGDKTETIPVRGVFEPGKPPVYTRTDGKKDEIKPPVGKDPEHPDELILGTEIANGTHQYRKLMADGTYVTPGDEVNPTKIEYPSNDPLGRKEAIVEYDPKAPLGTDRPKTTTTTFKDGHKEVDHAKPIAADDPRAKDKPWLIGATKEIISADGTKVTYQYADGASPDTGLKERTIYTKPTKDGVKEERKYAGQERETERDIVRPDGQVTTEQTGTDDQGRPFDAKKWTENAGTKDEFTTTQRFLKDGSGTVETRLEKKDPNAPKGEPPTLADQYSAIRYTPGNPPTVSALPAGIKPEDAKEEDWKTLTAAELERFKQPISETTGDDCTTRKTFLDGHTETTGFPDAPDKTVIELPLNDESGAIKKTIYTGENARVETEYSDRTTVQYGKEVDGKWQTEARADGLTEETIYKQPLDGKPRPDNKLFDRKYQDGHTTTGTIENGNRVEVDAYEGPTCGTDPDGKPFDGRTFQKRVYQGNPANADAQPISTESDGVETRIIDGKEVSVNYTRKVYNDSARGKVEETHFKDESGKERFEIKSERGPTITGRTEKTANGTVDIDDKTGKVIAMHVTSGPLPKGDYKLSYGPDGKVNEIVGPEGRMTKAADGKWTMVGLDGKPKDVALDAIGFRKDATGKVVGDISFNPNGDVRYNAKAEAGYSEMLRADGSRDAYDFNKYEWQHTAKDGTKAPAKYWDGYRYREAKEPPVTTPDGITRVKFKDDNPPNPSYPNPPSETVRDAKQDNLSVKLKDGTEIIANWRDGYQSHKKDGKETFYYNTGQVGGPENKPIWREGPNPREALKDEIGADGKPTGRKYVEFFPAKTPEELEALKAGRIPMKAIYDKTKGTVEAQFINRSTVISDGNGKVNEVRYPNGEGYKVIAGANGEPDRIEFGQMARKPDGSGIYLDTSRGVVLQRTGDKNPDGSARWSKIVDGKEVEVIDGAKLERNANGEFTLTGKVKGEDYKAVYETNGRVLTYGKDNQIREIRDSSGQTWNVSKVDGKPDTYSFALAGSKDKPIEGKLVPSPDGDVRINTGAEVVSKTSDGATIKYDATGQQKTEKSWPDGSSIKYDANERPTEIRDANGVVRVLTYKENSRIPETVSINGQVVERQDTGTPPKLRVVKPGGELDMTTSVSYADANVAVPEGSRIEYKNNDTDKTVTRTIAFRDGGKAEVVMDDKNRLRDEKYTNKDGTGYHVEYAAKPGDTTGLFLPKAVWKTDASGARVGTVPFAEFKDGKGMVLNDPAPTANDFTLVSFDGVSGQRREIRMRNGEPTVTDIKLDGSRDIREGADLKPLKSYNADGQLATTTDEKGNVKEFEYDSKDKDAKPVRVYVTTPDGKRTLVEAVDPSKPSEGLKVVKTDPADPTKVEYGAAVSYNKDTGSRLVREDGKDIEYPPEGGRYELDSTGRRVQGKNAQGADLFYKDGKLEKQVNPDKSEIIYDTVSGLPKKTKDSKGNEREFELKPIAIKPESASTTLPGWEITEVREKPAGATAFAVVARMTPQGVLVNADAQPKKVEFDQQGTKKTIIGYDQRGLPATYTEEYLSGRRVTVINGKKVSDTTDGSTAPVQGGPGGIAAPKAAELATPSPSEISSAKEGALPPAAEYKDQPKFDEQRDLLNKMAKVTEGDKPAAPGMDDPNLRTDAQKRTGDGADYKRQKDAADAHAERFQPPEQREALKKYLKEYEERAFKEGRAAGKNDDQIKAEIARTLYQFNRMLEFPDSGRGMPPGLEKADFARIAFGYMEGAARPADQTQGFNGTCGLKTQREALLREDPSKVGMFINDVLTRPQGKETGGTFDGTFLGPDGKSMVRVDYASFRADREAFQAFKNSGPDYKTADAADRNQFGQVWDIAAGNYLAQKDWKERNNVAPQTAVDTAFYTKGKGDVGANSDTGERTQIPGSAVKKESPNITNGMLAGLSLDLAGKSNVLANDATMATTDAGRAYEKSKGVEGFTTQERMQAILNDRLGVVNGKANPGGLHQSMMIDTGHPAFKIKGGREEGLHQVMVTEMRTIEIDGKPHTYYKVSDNNRDRWISAEDLFDASKKYTKTDAAKDADKTKLPVFIDDPSTKTLKRLDDAGVPQPTNIKMLELEKAAPKAADAPLPPPPPMAAGAKRQATANGSVDIDETTNRVTAMSVNPGGRMPAGNYKLGYGTDGKVNEITLPSGQVVRRAPNGDWQPKDAQVGVNLASGGDFSVSKNGDIIYDAKDKAGVKEWLRADGSKEVRNWNDYSRTITDKAGKETKEFWDGFGFRPAKSVNGGVVEFEPMPGRPVKMQRDSQNDRMIVAYPPPPNGDGRVVDCRWKEGKQTHEIPGQPPQTQTLFNTGVMDPATGKPIWKPGEEKSDASGKYVEFKDAKPGEPKRVRYSPKGEVTAEYANGARVTSDGTGHVQKVRYDAEGKNGYDIRRDAEGNITGVAFTDGRLLQKRADKGPDGADRFTLRGRDGKEETIEGKATFSPDGSLTIAGKNKTLSFEANGREITTTDGKLSRVREANGQTWNVKPVEGNKLEFSLESDPSKKIMGDAPVFAPDGSLRIRDGNNIRALNADGSQSTFDAQTQRELRRDIPGKGFLEFDEQGRVKTVGDASGKVVRSLVWGDAKPGEPPMSVKDGSNNVIEARDKNGVLRPVKNPPLVANAGDDITDKLDSTQAINYDTTSGARSVTKPNGDNTFTTTSESTSGDVSVVKKDAAGKELSRTITRADGSSATYEGTPPNALLMAYTDSSKQTFQLRYEGNPAKAPPTEIWKLVNGQPQLYAKVDTAKADVNDRGDALDRNKPRPMVLQNPAPTAQNYTIVSIAQNGTRTEINVKDEKPGAPVRIGLDGKPVAAGPEVPAPKAAEIPPGLPPGGTEGGKPAAFTTDGIAAAKEAAKPTTDAPVSPVPPADVPLAPLPPADKPPAVPALIVEGKSGLELAKSLYGDQPPGWSAVAPDLAKPEGRAQALAQKYYLAKTEQDRKQALDELALEAVRGDGNPAAVTAAKQIAAVDAAIQLDAAKGNPEATKAVLARLAGMYDSNEHAKQVMDNWLKDKPLSAAPDAKAPASAEKQSAFDDALRMARISKNSAASIAVTAAEADFLRRTDSPIDRANITLAADIQAAKLLLERGDGKSADLTRLRNEHQTKAAILDLHEGLNSGNLDQTAAALKQLEARAAGTPPDEVAKSVLEEFRKKQASETGAKPAGADILDRLKDGLALTDKTKRAELEQLLSANAANLSAAVNQTPAVVALAKDLDARKLADPETALRLARTGAEKTPAERKASDDKEVARLIKALEDEERKKPGFQQQEFDARKKEITERFKLASQNVDAGMAAVDASRDRFLDRASTPAQKEEELAKLRKMLETSAGPERERLRIVVDSFETAKLTATLQDNVRTGAGLGASARASDALEKLLDLSKRVPPNAAAKTVIDQLGGPEIAGQRLEGLRKPSDKDNFDASRHLEQKLNKSAEFLMSEMRQQRIMEGFTTTGDPVKDLDNIRTIQRKIIAEAEAAKKEGSDQAFGRAVDRKQWLDAAFALPNYAQISADATPEARMAGVKEITQYLVTLAKDGNPYAHQMLNQVLAYGSDQQSTNRIADLSGGEKDLPRPDLSKLKPEELLTAKTMAAAQLHTDAAKAQGVIDGADATALAAALAKARQDSTTLPPHLKAENEKLQKQLQSTIDLALASSY